MYIECMNMYLDISLDFYVLGGICKFLPSLICFFTTLPIDGHKSINSGGTILRKSSL